MKVILDLHAMPGGSSVGTYSGVWPLPPKFWQEKVAFGDSSTGKVNLTDAGLLVAQGMINWVAGLNKTEKSAVEGLTMMNEPGHLSAWADWASEDQILTWLEKSAELFRASSLPQNGIKLYMQIIETAFKDFTGTVGPWWKEKFTWDERHKWAVMDRHFYTAWSGETCSGRTIAGGKYFCDDPLDEIRKTVSKCTEKPMEDFAKNFDGLRAITEFSAGTHDQALSACSDLAVNRAYMEEQVKAFNRNHIQSFFWTWRMPYGTTFEPGWSLKYIMGMENSKNTFQCLAPTKNSTTL
eukprot:TRINITY_DN8906_c1_g1_i1.p1 TRINITY_DN8906_c1_g1~~TRINITY_DN8906_c1_g1_i1.p1  ORF type:complete len:295 (-),score=59.49 TRINITY_DN8906_c1_g1_i1:142-1026(-)